MDAAAIAQILTWSERAGIIAMLLVIVVAVIKGWWVPGYEYVHRVAERDKATDKLALAVETNRVLSEANKDHAESIKELTEHISRLTAGWRPPRLEQ